MTINREHLAPCPFCGFKPCASDEDCIYPATADRKVWGIHCYETGGGCSARILGNSPEDCVVQWNRRAQAAQVAEPVAFEDSWPAIAAGLPEHHRSGYCAGDVYAAERDAALAGWTAHAMLYTAPQHDAELVELLRECANTFALWHATPELRLKARIDAKLASLRHV